MRYALHQRFPQTKSPRPCRNAITSDFIASTAHEFASNVVYVPACMELT